MMSRARPWGCHFIESGRYPPIVLICGNAAETARLVRMVYRCSRSSGALPGGSLDRLYTERDARGRDAAQRFSVSSLSIESGVEAPGPAAVRTSRRCWR